MTTGATLKATLSTINGDNIPDTLWELLPDTVAGAQWRGEIWGATIRFTEWLNDEQEYTLSDLQDLTGSLADSEVEDYYHNINRRVQELSLWANTDLDEEVAELSHGRESLTLTDLNSLYLYCAMRGLYDVLAQWLTDTVEDMEEVG
jgi:hypothetical protein